MRTPSRRVPAAVPFMVAATVLLAGCSAGVEAGTLDPQRQSGSDADVGLVKIRNAVLVAPSDGSSAPVLSMTIVNDGTTEDSLTGVELAAAEGPVEITLSPATVELPAETATVFSGDDGPSLTVDDADIEPGTYVPVTFYFESAGSHSMDILVLSSIGLYGGAEPEGTAS